MGVQGLPYLGYMSPADRQTGGLTRERQSRLLATRNWNKQEKEFIRRSINRKLMGLGMRHTACGVVGAECRVWHAECAIQGVASGVHHTECGLQGAG